MSTITEITTGEELAEYYKKFPWTRPDPLALPRKPAVLKGDYRIGTKHLKFEAKNVDVDAPFVSSNSTSNKTNEKYIKDQPNDPIWEQSLFYE